MTAVKLSLKPGAALALVLEKHDSWRRGIRASLAGELRLFLETMGIPGETEVEIAQKPADTASLGHLWVNDQACRYPAEAAFSAASYVCPPAHSAIADWHGFNAWLRKSEERDLAEALAAVCRAALQENLPLLLGPAQRAAYLELLPREERHTLEPLLPALAVPLELGISLRDVKVVAATLRSAARGEDARDAGEALAGALRPKAIEIRMPRAYLQALTSGAEGPSEAFQLLRDGMFYELGVNYPRFRFVVDEALRPNGIALKVNDCTIGPLAGLLPGECLVNDTVDRLEPLGIKARRAVNPVNAGECAAIDSKQKKTAEDAGLRTWSALEYVVLACSATLRQKNSWLIDMREVRRHLDQLAQAFPALIEAAQKRYDLALLTGVLRLLAQEEVSIRDLRLILEALLDFDYIVADDASMIVFDERLTMFPSGDPAAVRDPLALAAFVRTRMKEQLSHKLGRGGNTIAVYLLDPKLESALTAGEGAAHDAAREKLLDGLRAEVAVLETNAAIPAILTLQRARRTVRQTIVHEFPRVPVISYQELSLRSNVQPIARISPTGRSGLPAMSASVVNEHSRKA